MFYISLVFLFIMKLIILRRTSSATMLTININNNNISVIKNLLGDYKYFVLVKKTLKVMHEYYNNVD